MKILVEKIYELITDLLKRKQKLIEKKVSKLQSMKSFNKLSKSLKSNSLQKGLSGEVYNINDPVKSQKNVVLDDVKEDENENIPSIENIDQEEGVKSKLDITGDQQEELNKSLESNHTKRTQRSMQRLKTNKSKLSKRTTKSKRAKKKKEKRKEPEPEPEDKQELTGEEN